jgi:NAD(P)-dependent dehydrogenase (short-subunit alcohol dehydrogenase family)
MLQPKSLSRVWAYEFGHKNITSNSISPGPVATERLLGFPEEVLNGMRQSIQRAPYKNFATVEDIVAVAVFLSSPASQRITGDVLNANGGLLYG